MNLTQSETTDFLKEKLLIFQNRTEQPVKTCRNCTDCPKNTEEESLIRASQFATTNQIK